MPHISADVPDLIKQAIQRFRLGANGAIRSESDVIREVLAKGLREMLLRDPRMAPGGGIHMTLRKAQLEHLTFTPTPEQIAAVKAAEEEGFRKFREKEAERERAESLARSAANDEAPDSGRESDLTEEQMAQIREETQREMAEWAAKEAANAPAPVAQVVPFRGAVSR